MRQDNIIFSGPNPFAQFGKCKELTILLDTDRFMFVASLNATYMMATFDSTVSVLEGTEDKFLKAYTIPLSLIFPLFKLDTGTKDNSLTLTTTADKVTIKYNDVEVESDIYSPNGLTIQQIKSIDIAKSQEVDPAPFIAITDVFGPTKDNFCNVDGNTLFISDENKCLIHKSKEDYGKKFSLPIPFIKLMKSMAVTKLHIGDNVVAETKSGVSLVTNLTKITDPNVLLDYKFAARTKSDDVYVLRINKYMKKISLAVQSVELSASLDFIKRKLILTSDHNERVEMTLNNYELSKQGEVDFFAAMKQSSSGKSLMLHDARLIRSLATFPEVKVKVCPGFLLAKLGKDYNLMFNLGKI